MDGKAKVYDFSGTIDECIFLFSAVQGARM